MDVLRLLDGIVSVYLPDMKYGDDATATQLSGALGYSAINRTAVVEMLRQVGQLRVDDDGIAVSGLIDQDELTVPRVSETRALALVLPRPGALESIFVSEG